MKKLPIILAALVVSIPAFAAFTGTTFSEVDDALDQISGKLARETSRVTAARAAFSSCVTNLDGIASDYSGIIAAAQALLDADPTNAALLNNRERVNQFLADRAALRAQCVALEAAVAP